MMNLNNILCSHFKPNKDGKVTIGHVADFALKTSILTSLLCLFMMWIGGVTMYMCEQFGIISESDIPQYIVNGEVVASCIFFLFAGLLLLASSCVIFALILLGAYIIDRICSIEIASCPINKEDEDENDSTAMRLIK